MLDSIGTTFPKSLTGFQLRDNAFSLAGIHCFSQSTPDLFHKGSQEKKHFSCGRSFSCVQPAPLSRFVLAFRSVSSGRYVVAVALLVFSPSGFHHFFATKPVRSETNKQYGCQVATMVPFGTRGP